MADLNKELDDFYDQVDFSQYDIAVGGSDIKEKENDLDDVINGIEKLTMKNKLNFELKPTKFFQNSNSLDDEIIFVEHLGYCQPSHSKNKLKTPRLVNRNNNNSSNDFAKNLFNHSATEKMNEMKKHYDKLNNLIKAETEDAFEINMKFTIKIGNQYYYSNDQIFDWSKEIKIIEFLKLKGLNSSFTDHTKINKSETLSSLLNETKFVKQELTKSFKLLLINRDCLFQNIFGKILTNHTLNENDRRVIETVMSSKLIDLKIDHNYKLVRISIAEHSKYYGLKSNIDVINDTISCPSFSGPISNALNLKQKSWGSYKYDTRFQLKQAVTIDGSSYKKFNLLQNAIAEYIRLPNRRSKQVFLKCKRNQFQYLREKMITAYKYIYASDDLKDFNISFNTVNYIEYHLNKKNQTDSELCLRPNFESFISLSVTSFLTEIIKSEDSKLKFNEIFCNSWDLGQWLAQTGSLCV